MKFRHNSSNSAALGRKDYLEFAVHLLELGYFDPVVFSHDHFWFDRNRYAQVMIGFVNLLSFFYSCGVTVDTEVLEPCELETVIYGEIMRDGDMTDIIKCYELSEIDFTCFDLQNARVPQACRADDFDFVKIYLRLRTGAALNKRALENMLGKSLSDAEMLSFRRQLQDASGKDIVKRDDNSYEMR